DDIIYPRDYVQQMLTRLLFYNDSVVLGVHGILLRPQFQNLSYYHPQAREVLHFREALPTDRFVHVLGTGTVAYHASVLPSLTFADFRVPGMADIWLAAAAKHAD